MMTRLIDFLKSQGITTFFTSLTGGGEEIEQTDVGVSSLVDTWLLLAVLRSKGERNRSLTVIKSRGMPHSNQAAEYVLSNDGIQLRDTYLGPSGVLTGSERLAQEAADAAAAAAHDVEIARKQQERERRRKAVEHQIAALREELETQDLEMQRAIEAETRRRDGVTVARQAMAQSRRAFAQTGSKKNRSQR
jgi:circadian clock protein KaiC